MPHRRGYVCEIPKVLFKLLRLLLLFRDLFSLVNPSPRCDIHYSSEFINTTVPKRTNPKKTTGICKPVKCRLNTLHNRSENGGILKKKLLKHQFFTHEQHHTTQILISFSFELALFLLLTPSNSSLVSNGLSHSMDIFSWSVVKQLAKYDHAKAIGNKWFVQL